MLTQYESTFTIAAGAVGDNEADAAGLSRLRQVVRLAMDELQAATGQPSPDLEQGATNSAGYAAISTEREYPGRPELSIRLEARFCTGDDGLAAQIHTRFISADGSDPPNLLAGPPRLLRTIAEQFPCHRGITPISSAATEVAAADAAAFTTDHIRSPDRTLPILVISTDRHGHTAVIPQQAADYLAGIAQVAVLDDNGTTAGVPACYNGSIRLYWPLRNSSVPSKYYSKEDAARIALYELQQICLTHAPDNDFDHRFSLVRADVILERNRHLEAERQQRTPSPAPSDIGDATELHREIRRAQLRGNEANRKLNIANETIAQLQKDLAAAEDRNTYLAESAVPDSDETDTEHPRDRAHRLRVTNQELRERAAASTATIERLNADNQSLRQVINRRRQEDRAAAIPLTGNPADNITVLNHAVNIYRDRMRHYIIASLRQQFGNNLTDCLAGGGIVELAWHRTRELAASDPEAFIDVDVFEDIVVTYPECFSASDLPRKLREIKRIRNSAAHPPPQGIDYVNMQDGLRTISEVMAIIGAAPAGSAITNLMHLTQHCAI